MTSPTDLPEPSRLPPPPADPMWLTIDEAAARIRVNPRTIDRYEQDGRLPVHRLGDGPKAPKRYRPADVDALLIPGTARAEDA